MNATTLPTVRPEDEQLGITKNFAYGLQHVLTMYGGIIAVPLIIGSAAGLKPAEIGTLIAASLFMGGVATLVQTLGFKYVGAKLPIVQGVSFAGVATMLAIINTGGSLPMVFGAVMVASLLGLILSPFFSRLLRFFPPVVTGSVITMIGLSLIPVSIRWIMGGNPKAPTWGDPGNVGLALATLFVILLLNMTRNPLVRRLAILIAMIIGTLIAAMFGMVDFSKVGTGAFFALPNIFQFGMPVFDMAAIISMSIVTLVIMTETTADILAVGEIVGTPVDERRVGDGLRADMLSSAIAPMFGSFMQTAFAQNVGLVAMTGIKSRFVVATAGAILVTLGLLPVLGRVLASIPMPVLGGAGIILFGSVAVSGIRTLAKVDYNNQNNLIIVATAISIGLIPVVNNEFYEHFPSWVKTLFHSGISSTCITAILLNILFNSKFFTKEKNSVTDSQEMSTTYQ
ncbi:uracil permease [Moraxella osloensis]|uniref:Uracil permease n=1 Tax=Faucicola osloensis TaxID=34062 RepID=A0A2I1RFA6_FAUOS|nr:nucleobase:cation symporter-2 family protein [Moraxella osloensis]PKZ67805.1 uracil permease [Moraxella osloensis]